MGSYLVEQRALTAHIKPCQHQQSDAQYQWSPKPTLPWSAGGTLIQQPVTFETKVSILWFWSKCICSLSLAVATAICYSQTNTQTGNPFGTSEAEGLFMPSNWGLQCSAEQISWKLNQERAPPWNYIGFLIFLSQRRCHFAIAFCSAVRKVLLVLMEHVSYIVCIGLFEDFLGSRLINLTNKCIPLLEGIPQHRLRSF